MIIFHLLVINLHLLLVIINKKNQINKIIFGFYYCKKHLLKYIKIIII